MQPARVLLRSTAHSLELVTVSKQITLKLSEKPAGTAVTISTLSNSWSWTQKKI